MTSLVIVFGSSELADWVLAEIACTPDIEGGGAVAVALPEDFTRPCPYLPGADGRVAVAHWVSDAPGHWSEAVCDWLEAYLAEWIASGQVRLLKELPADWQCPEVA